MNPFLFQSICPCIAANGFGLCVRAGFGAQNCQPALNLNRRKKLQACTSPRLTQNPCYAFALLFLSSVLLSFRVGFVVRLLGGSFAIFGLCVCLCELQMCHQLVMAVNILICLSLLGHPFVLHRSDILLQVA